MRARTTVVLALIAPVMGCGERQAGLDVAPNVVDRARLGSELLFLDASRNEVDAVDVMQQTPTPSVRRIAVPANPRFVVERSGGVRRAAAAPNGGTGGASSVIDPSGALTGEGSGKSPEQVLVLSDGSKDAGGDYVDMPSLTVINQLHELTHYELSQPFGQLVLSDDGRYALLWGQSTTGVSDGLLTNPNGVALVDLEADPEQGINPFERTLKATGGSVTDAMITPALNILGEPRSIALFSYGNGLGIWDTAHPDKEDITAQGLTATGQLQLKRVVADADNAKLYLVQQDQPDLRVFSFPATDDPTASNDFRVSLNQLQLTPTGASGASDMVPFTEASVAKLLVAEGSKLAIVDADQSQVVPVPLALGGEAQRIWSFVGASPNDNDKNKQRVLLWFPGRSTVSFVELNNLEKAKAQNIEQLALGYPLTNLVPLNGNLMLAVLGGGGIGTLDLDSRRFRPLGATVAISLPLIESDARRVWVGGNRQDYRIGFFEPVTLATGSLRLDSVVEELFLFENGDDRRVVATHSSPIGELSIVDGTKVTRASSRVLTGFLVDGLVNR